VLNTLTKSELETNVAHVIQVLKGY